jgi:cob(I)alamin adenosyltransferase
MLTQGRNQEKTMPIYTKVGDKGFTVLPRGGGKPALRVRKDDPRLAALGEVDELNAVLGLCAAEARRTRRTAIAAWVEEIQEHLLTVGSTLAADAGGYAPAVMLDAGAIAQMEQDIDALTCDMPPLANFLLPGGCELAARLHLARTVARRAERAVVGTLRPGVGNRTATRADVVLRYLNRLSDFIFTLARAANHQGKTKEAVRQGAGKKR